MDRMDNLNLNQEMQQPQVLFQTQQEQRETEEEKQRQFLAEQNRKMLEEAFAYSEEEQLEKEKKNQTVYKNHLQSKLMKTYKQTDHLLVANPTLAEMNGEYSTGYKEQVSQKSRKKKIKNKKSRLYHKDELAKQLEDADAQQFKNRDVAARLRMSVTEEQRHAFSPQKLKDISELSRLLSNNKLEQADKFDDLLNKMGDFVFEDQKTAQDAGATEEVKPKRKSAKEAAAAKAEILQELSYRILKINIGAVTDEAIAKNAQKFEDNAKLVEIYERMLEESPGYLDAIDNKDKIQEKESSIKEKIMERVERVKAVSAYYKVRKLILTNPYYRTHYNEELSMNTTREDSPEQRFLSKLLRTSFYLGKNLQEFGAQVEKKSTTEENRKVKAKLDLPEDDYNAAFESKACLISSDAADYENSDDMVKLEKKIREKSQLAEREKNAEEKEQLEKKKAELKKKSKEKYQERRDSLVAELERESKYMPSKYFGKVDSMKLSEEKLTKDHLLRTYYTNETHVGHVVAYKEGAYNTNVLERILKMNETRSGSLGIQSKSMAKQMNNDTGNLDLGDSLHRQSKPFATAFYDDMTENEVVELYNNLTYTKQKDYNEENFSEEERKAEEAHFHEAMYTYIDHAYAQMRSMLNSLGDTFSYMHPVDAVKVLNEKNATFWLNSMYTLTNAEQANVLGFLKKFSTHSTEHLADFGVLVDGLSMQMDAMQEVRNQFKLSDTDVDEYGEWDDKNYEKDGENALELQKRMEKAQKAYEDAVKKKASEEVLNKLLKEKELAEFAAFVPPMQGEKKNVLFSEVDHSFIKEADARLLLSDKLESGVEHRDFGGNVSANSGMHGYQQMLDALKLTVIGITNRTPPEVRERKLKEFENAPNKAEIERKMEAKLREYMPITSEKKKAKYKKTVKSRKLGSTILDIDSDPAIKEEWEDFLKIEASNLKNKRYFPE